MRRHRRPQLRLITNVRPPIPERTETDDKLVVAALIVGAIVVGIGLASVFG